MTAPDKIYVQPNAHDRWFEGNMPNDNFVEYIRKDALIEWLNDNIKPLNVLFGEIFVGRVKDKLNSM